MTPLGAGVAARPTTRVLQRVVLPVGADQDVLPLYVDGDVLAGTGLPLPDGLPVVGSGSTSLAVDQVTGRRSFRLPAGTRASFATYFNAFPASYWRRWSVVESITLRVRTSGPGTVAVYRSNAKGNTQRVVAEAVDGTSAESAFDLTLSPFNDGGWYWFDLVAGAQPFALQEAEWVAAVPAEHAAKGARHGRATVAITTFNRADYCARLLTTLGEADGLTDVVAEVVVVDQGTQKVADDENYPAAAAALGSRLRIVTQPNLGGSGGFSRGMLETLRGDSDYVLLLDDDVMVEPEGIARGVVFADLARATTIVGGHMFSMYSRSLLHAYAERVQKWRFWWGEVNGSYVDHDLGAHNLRLTPWLHRRFDVDYNGWWMCLIPREVIEAIGLSLPLFIKWDDAEYGLRAAAADIPTVSLPGMAVWHVPWTDKDDAIDWQAYHHARNRVVAALLHSPYPRGGNVVRESLTTQVKHLLSMQYSTAALRLVAIEDVLAGPGGMHEQLPNKLGEIRALRSASSDATYKRDATAYPPARRRKPPRRGKEPEVPKGRLAVLTSAATGILKQLRPGDELAATHPQGSIPHRDARWWMLSQYDSALVSAADGTGVAWYRRDRGRFAELLRRTIVVHQRLALEWPELAASYQQALPDLVSRASWEATTGARRLTSVPVGAGAGRAAGRSA